MEFLVGATENYYVLVSRPCQSLAPLGEAEATPLSLLVGNMPSQGILYKVLSLAQAFRLEHFSKLTLCD